MPNYFIKTYGCQMNVNDSEILAGILEQSGYEQAPDYKDADVILVNTCSIRQKAENKAYSFLHEVKKLKKSNPDLIIGICGCVAQQEKEKIMHRLPFVDLVMGPQGIDEFASLLLGMDSKNEPTLFFRESSSPRKILPAKRAKSPRAYISIMYGCNNYCSYCIVPYVRGRKVFRPFQDIIEEIKALDKSIYKEIILLGQSVNSWKGEGEVNLSHLLREVHEVDGVEWVGFLTSHPKDMTDDIIDAVAELPKVNKYIHLPVQSGSSKILAVMNRGYDRDYYLRLVEKIYNKIPDVTLTSDIIVGFPGESDQDFKDSLNMVAQANFDSVITAAYSVRPGTSAASMNGQLDVAVKKDRLQKIMRVVEDVAHAKNQRFKGKTLDVLVEGQSKKGKLAGRTRGSKIVYFEGRNILPSEIVSVTITSAKSWVLEGVLNNAKF